MILAEEVIARPELQESTSPVAHKRLLLYLLPMLLSPTLLLAAAFLIVPTQWFTLHSGNTYMANIGYADTLTNASCQILIYGDSTAMTSLDPFLIESRTHLKACNIAEFEGMTSVNQTLLLDRYLIRNPRPRFLVFMYTPEDLGIPQHWNKVSSFEAVTYRIRQGLDPATLRLLLSHPVDTFGWAEQGMRMTLFRFATKPLSPDKLNLRAPYNGQLRLTGQTMTACGQEDHREGIDPAWISHLRAKYGVQGTTVLVDATPAPACDVDLPYFKQALSGLIDDTPYPAYPSNVYLKNTRMHMNETGSAMVSIMIANQINSQLHAGGR